MTLLWRRWRRLCRQSEIRLSPQAVDAAAVEPGDRLQIGPRLWRVERRRTDGGLELGSGDDAAVLRHTGVGAACPWILEADGVEIRVASRDVLRFAVGRHLRLGSARRCQSSRPPSRPARNRK